MEEFQRASLEQLLALLEAARGELEAGWVQDGWWSVPRAGATPALPQSGWPPAFPGLTR